MLIQCLSTDHMPQVLVLDDSSFDVENGEASAVHDLLLLPWSHA
jgi:hypothetical protein